MELRPYTDTDAWLTERLETDPAVMAELGGVVDKDALPELHARRLATVEAGDWWFVIESDRTEPIGVIGIWPSEVDGRMEHEAGWMVIPKAQGQGVATRALSILLERARDEARVRVIHAYPGAANAPSNALCARAGFVLVGQLEVAYKGAPFQTNHWKLDVES